MVRIYTYNDIGEFSKPNCKVKTRVSSNLCTHYYNDKHRFCGNYCSRKVLKFNNRCWRHKRVQIQGPAVVLLMISSSDRFFNRDVWVEFLNKCEERGVNIHLVVYHEDMMNCTVRQPNNIISRFRPFPDIFGYKVFPIRNSHGSLNYAQVYLKMLEYGCKVPNAVTCIPITERTIPIRSPKKIYKRALRSKCHINISYNVGYGPVPPNLPLRRRGKPFAGVNNSAQGLYSVDFLKVALPSVRRHCNKFGVSPSNNCYSVSNKALYNTWRKFTAANLDEFWLLNSYLLDTHERDNKPMDRIKAYMEKTNESDVYTVAEIPQQRDGWKRTYIFRDSTRKVTIQWFDKRVAAYYRGLNNNVSLKEVISFLRVNKRRALFFRQVELP